MTTTTLRVRRGAAALTGAALLAAGLSAVAPAPAGAATARTTSAVSWLSAQLNPQGRFSDNAENLGVTLDFAVGLSQTGAGDAALRTKLLGGIDGLADAYAGTTADPAKAARIARLAYSVSQIDGDPSAVSGNDYLGFTEDLVGADGVLAGGSQVYGQVWAALALAAAGSPEATAASDALAGLQCADGSFGFVDGSTCYSDQDYTAYSIIALLPRLCDAAVGDVVRRAVTWLRNQQSADGGFGKNDFGGPDNTNTTGIAAYALGRAGATAASARASLWVYDRQIAAGAAAPLDGEGGAIAYSSTELDTARTDGIADGAVRDQFVFATAQAFPALEPTPASTGPQLQASALRFAKAGASVGIAFKGVGFDSPVCVTFAGTTVQVKGGATEKVGFAVPAGTASYTATVATGTGTVSVPITALAATRLAVTRTESSLRRGARQVIRVTGLVPGERVVVRYRGKVIERGRASASGTFRDGFRVGSSRGLKTVRVLGEFDDRAGLARFRVR